MYIAGDGGGVGGGGGEARRREEEAASHFVARTSEIPHFSANPHSSDCLSSSVDNVRVVNLNLGDLRSDVLIICVSGE